MAIDYSFLSSFKICPTLVRVLDVMRLCIDELWLGVYVLGLCVYILELRWLNL